MPTFRFAFDHSVSDGAGGYGAVQVATPDDEVWYIGRGFAPTVLVERFPDAGLTYDDAASLVADLSRTPSFSRTIVREPVAESPWCKRCGLGGHAVESCDVYC